MSLIPGNVAGINVISPKPGSGLTVSTVANVDTITTDNFIQGTGIVLTRDTTLNTLTINSSALGSGVVSVTEALPQGSGVIVNSTPGPAVAVTVQGAYNAGTNISLTPSATPGNQTIAINNTMALTAGAGITVGQAGPGQNATIANNIVGGTNINITGTTPGGSKQVNNTMAVSAGAGIAVTQSAPGANATVANTMAVSASGAGIAVTQTGGAGNNVSIANTGVTSLVAGDGITLSGSTGAITISSSPHTGTPNWFFLYQSDPSSYGYGYIVNGGSLAIVPQPNSSFLNYLNAASALDSQDILVQFTLQLSASPSTPPGGPITVQIWRGATQIVTTAINSPTIYPSPYQYGGAWNIMADLPYSAFAGTTGDFTVQVINNYGAVIYCVMTSPVAVFTGGL